MKCSLYASLAYSIHGNPNMYRKIIERLGELKPQKPVRNDIDPNNNEIENNVLSNYLVKCCQEYRRKIVLYSVHREGTSFAFKSEEFGICDYQELKLLRTSW